METDIKGRNIEDGTPTVLIVGDEDSAAYTLALARLFPADKKVTISINSLGGVAGAHPLKPLEPISLEKPKNHPHGWYRQFEKRSKRK